MKNKIFKTLTLVLLISLLCTTLTGCKIQLSEDEYTVGEIPKGSYRLVYYIVNEDQNIDGDLTFKYVTDGNITKMQSYAEFDMWQYRAQVIFDTDTLIPSSSYKSNVFYSGKEKDWSVKTDYTKEKATIKAIQEDKQADKEVAKPARYLDNEMINLTLGLIEIEQGDKVYINVLVNESAMFAPYVVTNQTMETITVNGKSYECVKYSAKYAGFSLFTARESYFWYTNDRDRRLVKFVSGSQIMTLKEIIEVPADEPWLFGE